MYKETLTRLVLSATYYWVRLSIWSVRFLTAVLGSLLELPENLIALLDWLPDKHVKTTDGKKINIINAFNENGCITNKFKLFLKVYWTEGGEDQLFDYNGVDMSKFAQLLNCSMLYCSYLLTEENKEISPSEFLNKVKNVFVVKKDRRFIRGNQPLPVDCLDFEDHVGHVQKLVQQIEEKSGVMSGGASLPIVAGLPSGASLQGNASSLPSTPLNTSSLD